ncbi:MAG: hypothetical protein HQK53_05050 [Oligoflexia bacterium]|nr:hypothetical protein [Oligoflexia bacterium]
MNTNNRYAKLNLSLTGRYLKFSFFILLFFSIIPFSFGKSESHLSALHKNQHKKIFIKSKQQIAAIKHEYDSLMPDSEEWKRLSVRNSASKIQPNYLHRLRRSITEVFAPWFEGKDEFKDFSFEDMIRKEHLILVTGGNDGSPQYNGVTGLEYNIKIADIPAGVFRYQTNAPISFTFRMDKKLNSEEVSDRLYRLRTSYTQTLEIPNFPKWPECEEEFTMANFFAPYASRDILVFPRLTSGEAHASNWIYSNSITHIYPSPQALKNILRVMGAILEEIRALPPNAISLKQLLNLLDEYVYLGINAHIFHSANYSLIASQMNFILSRFGLKGISSWNLDWVGLSEQLPEFSIILRKKISEVNPEIKQYSPQHEISPKLAITVHMQDFGDSDFVDNEIIENLDGRRIEGLSIVSTLPQGLILEYMGHIAKIGDTVWAPERFWVGTQGLFLGLEGIAIRVVNSNSIFKGKFDIFYQIKNSDGWSKVCSNSEYCGTKSENKSISGLKIWTQFSHAD